MKTTWDVGVAGGTHSSVEQGFKEPAWVHPTVQGELQWVASLLQPGPMRGGHATMRFPSLEVEPKTYLTNLAYLPLRRLTGTCTSGIQHASAVHPALQLHVIHDDLCCLESAHKHAMPPSQSTTADETTIKHANQHTQGGRGWCSFPCPLPSDSSLLARPEA